jgi:hypothetical protein
MKIAGLRTVALASVVFSSCLAAPSYAARDIYAEQAPPEPKLERVPAARDGYFWGQGHWALGGKSWYWVGGSWIIQRRGMNWVPDHWETEGERWHFIPAHWEHG